MVSSLNCSRYIAYYYNWRERYVFSIVRTMKDLANIIRRNFFTPIVLAIFTLSVVLLLLNEVRDAIFISAVIAVNTLLAVVQEVRARIALRKLELMSKPTARRRTTGGIFQQVPFDQLVVNDEIQLLAGDEIPADSRVLHSRGAEVDESLLTGESAAVQKRTDDTLYASTTVVAGEALARVTAVGNDTKAGAMSASLKRYTPELTPIQRHINSAITILAYGAIGLAVLIGVSYSLMGEDLIRIIKTITAAAVTIVPEGLLLASSLLLAYGSLRLAAVKVLPQKISAIEGMALLNTLCVDKTGTLTAPEIIFEQLQWFAKRDDTAINRAIVGAIARETSGGNATGQAITKGLPPQGTLTIDDVLAFSSKRKLSGLRFTLKQNTQAWIMGAPEFVDRIAPLESVQQKTISEQTKAGGRVLLIARLADPDTLHALQPASAQTLGIITLSNQLRDHVTETVSFLQSSGVTLRVISGDNPETVQYIARRANIANPEQIITGSELAQLSGQDWQRAVSDSTIFARVLPEQKEQIIATLRQQKRFTGMVGDGVNDALALKKADLGIAMNAGAAATRRVADIVLLDNSFTALPIGLSLGNRIMQAIEVIAALFFHKLIFNTSLLLLTMAIGLTFPFEPRHVTFMNIFLVTLPTLMWTVFPPSPTHRIDPRRFWRDTLLSIIPIALLSAVTVTFVYWYLSATHPDDRNGVVTTTVIVTTFFGVYLVFLASRLLNVTYDRTAALARIIFVLSVVVIAAISFGFGLMRDFFDFTQPAWAQTTPVLAAIIAVVLAQWILARTASRRIATTTVSRQQVVS